MAPSTTLLLYLSLGLIALAYGYPYDLNDAEVVDELLNDDGDLDGMVDGGLTEGDEMGDDGMTAQDRLVAYYDQRDKKGARWNKNFVGVSSLDRSITAYTSFLPCRVEGVCKQKFKKVFRCKCNQHTYCVAAGRKYEARCRYSAVGHVFRQP